MTKGRRVLSYAEQRAICRAIFQGFPALEPELLEEVVKTYYHGTWTMTRSEIADARRWVQALPQVPGGDKANYMIAWLILHPDLSLATLDGYTRTFFGEGSRQETYDRCRVMAQTAGWTAAEARAVIARCEVHVVNRRPGFDFAAVEDAG